MKGNGGIGCVVSDIVTGLVIKKAETVTFMDNFDSTFFALTSADRDRSDVEITKDGLLIRKLKGFAIVPLEKYEELIPAIRSAKRLAHQPPLS